MTVTTKDSGPAAMSVQQAAAAAAAVGVAVWLVGSVVLLDFAFAGLAVTAAAAGSPSSAVEGGGTTRDFCQLEIFQAECKDAEVVVLQVALYGRMRIGRCVRRNYGHVGCSRNVLPAADRLCSGRLRGCAFAVSSLHQYQPCPGDLTPYLEASYECVPVITGSSRLDAPCGQRSPLILTAEDGYLASAVTMETGRGGPECPWRIHLLPGRRVNLTLISFNLGPNNRSSGTKSSGACYQLAIIREDRFVRTLTECEGAERESHAYLSITNDVRVEVLSTKSSAPIYFLLRYHAVGCLSPSLSSAVSVFREGDDAIVKCNATGDTWRLRCSGSRWIGAAGNCSASGLTAGWADDDDDNGRGNGGDGGEGGARHRFPYSILVVVASGVTLGVIVGGILLACTASYFRRHQDRDISCDYASQGGYCDDAISKTFEIVQRMKSIELFDDDDSKLSVKLQNSSFNLSSSKALHFSHRASSPTSITSHSTTSRYVDTMTSQTVATATGSRHFGVVKATEEKDRSTFYGAPNSSLLSSESSQLACKREACDCSRVAYNTLSKLTSARCNARPPIQVRHCRMHVYESPQSEAMEDKLTGTQQSNQR